MVRLQTLDLRIGVRVPASQPINTMKYRTLCLLPLFCFALWSQEAPPSATPPPGVDEALRARVAQFYSANISGKWRDAFAVVADDMQNEYLAASKDTYDKCETMKITYSDNFTKATVRENCHGEYRWHNSHLPATIPLTSTWKVVDGQWYWYWLKPTEVMTPWGLSTVTPDDPKGTAAAKVNANVETVLKDPASMAKAILSQIKVDKKEIHLLGYESSKDELHISNTMPGTISVKINCAPLPGFKIKQAAEDVGPNQSLAVGFEYDADEAKRLCGECYKLPKPMLTATVRMEPTAQTFAIKITFALSPDQEKQLPKELRPKTPPLNPPIK